MRATLGTVPRRRTELGLLILALAITGCAYALVSLGRTAVLPTNLRPFLLVIAGLLATAHIATRRLARFADASLLWLILEGAAHFISEEVRYIYKKQLEEADIIILNKTDLITKDQLAQIDKVIKNEYPQKTINQNDD